MVMKTRIFVFLFGFLFLFSQPVMAQFPEISAEQLRSYLTGKKKITLVDTRTAEEYQLAHIPGAVNIMPDDMKASVAKLPKDKAALIIFYCRGMEWGLSKLAAGAATEMGFSAVMVYQAGMPYWQAKGYPVQKGNKPGSMK
jgi:rhodanese-related sulfurtransferase